MISLDNDKVLNLIKDNSEPVLAEELVRRIDTFNKDREEILNAELYNFNYIDLSHDSEYDVSEVTSNILSLGTYSSESIDRYFESLGNLAEIVVGKFLK